MPVLDRSQPEPADLRMPLLAVAAWAGALVGTWWSARVLLGIVVGVGLALVVVALLVGRGPGWRQGVRTGAMLVVVLTAVAGTAALHREQVRTDPVAALARDGAAVTARAQVTGDPRAVRGRHGDVVIVRVSLTEVTGRGQTYQVAAPVLVLADESWSHVALGSMVRTSGLLAAPDDADLSALLRARGSPDIVAGPDLWWRGADAVRASLRDSVAHRPGPQRALVPALVDGDDAGLDPAVAEEFRATGLTHLLAVSGTNLTLVVGFLLLVARWCGVRRRWLHLVGAVGIAGFVLLARTEPSVLRAAVMGAVALVGLGANGRQRGVRTLGAAVVVLLLVRPGLGTSLGFTLSVLATAGILFLAPRWRDGLSAWLPRWLAEAVAVPVAAQLACTPVIAAISGQVSLVAVAANLLVAPVVGPATVLGLAGGLVGLVWSGGGHLFGTGAGWCVGWIVLLADRGAALPSAAIAWGTGVGSVALLAAVSLALAVLGPLLLRHRSAGLACGALLLVVVAVPLPTPGWPPPGWVLVACDVGQGDALVLRSGPHAGVVVDAGPDPAAVERCLDRLAIRTVPLVVLTHFHADHVDGLPGVLRDRRVAALETTGLMDPPGGVALVRSSVQRSGLPWSSSRYGLTRRIGQVTFQVLWPLPGSPVAGPGDGSTANEASEVLLAQVRGVRLLLAGDLEPEGQARLARDLPGLSVDVLKVPHHGSRYQDLDFLTGLRARVAVVSVGQDNDYGHPNPSVLAALSRGGARVLRTDLDGDVAVVEQDGELRVVTSR